MDVDMGVYAVTAAGFVLAVALVLTAIGTAVLMRHQVGNGWHDRPSPK